MILSVCLNPALQRTLVFQHIHPGHVNRTSEVYVSTGGKGVNVARVVKQLGASSTLIGVFGGETGRQACALLEEQGVHVLAVDTHHPTRICQTLIDQQNNQQTELVEESRPVCADPASQTYSLLTEQVLKHQMLVLSGTVPVGFTDIVYADYVRLAHQERIPSIVDASGDLLLNALNASPWFVKPNRSELEITLKSNLDTLPSLHSGIRQLAQKGAQTILVTDHDRDAWLLFQDKIHRIRFPKLRILNPIGSGDAIAAGIVSFTLKFPHRNFMDAVVYGMACGCANVQTLLAGHVQSSVVETLIRDIQIEMVNE